ncbi:hypothetical protein CRE_05864 [Caenorhabditis remanei]|uniref:Uncharacterized protein n=1 Tax=Caenorhabditis remanei TaxID=31234 RepID=E3MNS1_CAERE|nr:hypothetical protein CRE_05864 [Caenorhabditis remanei]
MYWKTGKRINGSTVPSQDGVFAVTFSGITQTINAYSRLSATTYYFLGAAVVCFGGDNTGHGGFKLSATTYYFLGPNAACVCCGGKNAGQGRLCLT